MTQEETSGKSSEKAIEKKILESKEYDTEKLHLVIEKGEKCRITVTANAKKSLLEEAHKGAVKNISKEVSIPGFRKGKAPAHLIEKKYPGALKEAAEKALADIAFKEAQKAGHLHILHGNANVSYHVEKMSENEGVVSFRFEAEPDVPTLDMKIFALENKPAEVIDDTKVSETIDNIRKFYAEWQQIEDRPVQEGDVLTLDIDNCEGETPVRVFNGARLEVTPAQMATWMRELVIGKNIGDEVEGVSRAEDSDSEETKKEFEPKKAKLYIRSIEVAKLPPLDDEFAKKVGVDTVETLRSRILELRTKQAAEFQKQALREQVAKQILEKVQFEVPGSILEKEANHRMSGMMREPAFREKWENSMTAEEKDEHKKKLLKDSDDAIRLFYVCRKVVNDNKIPLSEDELAPHYEGLLDMMFADPARVNYRNQSEAQQAMQFSKYMLEKAEDFIIEKALSA